MEKMNKKEKEIFEEAYIRASKERSKEEKLFDEKYYQLIRFPLEFITKNPGKVDETISLWKKAVPFIREYFMEIKNGRNRAHSCELDAGSSYWYSIIGVNDIHFFVAGIVNLLIDRGRFEDAFQKK